MSLDAAHTNLKALLSADSGLTNWANTHFGKIFTAIDGNVPVKDIAPATLPALIFEFDDGDTENLSVGGKRQLFKFGWHVVVMWNEQDRAKAFTQRKQLPELMAKAVMANNNLSGAVGGAWLADFVPDRGVNHPRHVWRSRVRAEMNVNA